MATKAEILALPAETFPQLGRASDDGHWYLVAPNDAGSLAERVFADDEPPITVADATARKALTDVFVGVTRVIQSDLGGVIWLLIGSNPALDASWTSQLYSDGAKPLGPANADLVWELRQTIRQQPRVNGIATAKVTFTSLNNQIYVQNGSANSGAYTLSSGVRPRANSVTTGPVFVGFSTKNTAAVVRAAGLRNETNAWYGLSLGNNGGLVNGCQGFRDWLAVNLFSKITPVGFFTPVVGSANSGTQTTTTITGSTPIYNTYNDHRTFTIPTAGTYLLKFWVPGRSGTQYPEFDLLVKDSRNSNSYSLIEMGAIEPPALLNGTVDLGARLHQCVLKMNAGQTLRLILRAWRGGHTQVFNNTAGGTWAGVTGSGTFPAINTIKITGVGVSSSGSAVQLKWNTDQSFASSSSLTQQSEAVGEFLLQLIRLSDETL